MRKTTTIAAIVALSAAMLSACGASPGTDAVGNSMKTGSSSSTSSSSSSSSDASTPEDTPSTEDTPEGPKTFGLGQAATVTQDGQDAATIVVSKVDVKTRPESEYGDKPKNGRFKLITLTVRAVGTDTFDVNPFDFYLRDAEGNKYDAFDGNSIGAFDRTEIHAETLNPKEQVKGTLVFDVPAAAKEFVYAPMDQSLGIWKIK